MVSLILSLILFGGNEQVPPQQAPPPIITRDAARSGSTATPTAVIRGRVTERDSGRPVPRATVTLMSPSIRQSPNDGPLQTLTAGDGSYEFRDLPAGAYNVSVAPAMFRGLHLRQTYGEDLPGSVAPRRRPRPIMVAEGEVREDVNVALWRAFAIEGRVVDDLGEAMAGVHVMPRAADTGQSVGMSGPYQFSTDDRGAFRIFGLAPGRYLVCANPRMYSVSARTEVRERYIETCHPAAIADGDAQPITLAGADVGGVEIRVQRSRAFTVTGLALDSFGAPLKPGQVNLMRFERNGGSGSGIDVRPDGQFVARGLVPGEYAISASTVERRGPDVSGDGEFAHLLFRIDNSDVEGLMVVTSKAGKVAGRVVFEEDGSGSPAAASMRVTTMADISSRRMMMGPQPSVRVGADLTFELTGLVEPVAIGIAWSGTPAGWVVKTVRYKAQDVTDKLVDFSGARESDTIEIVLTNRVARLSGRVTDDQGNPVQDAIVMLLSADPAQWRMRGAGHSAGPGPDGAFKVGPVRAGEYLIVAAPLDAVGMMMGMRTDTKAIERLAALAQRITVGENEEPVVNLRVVKPQ